MKRFSVPEYGRIKRTELDARLIRRLQAFDERHAKATGACVFDWDHIHYIAAQNYVGVVQVPGLTIEILPKIDTADEDHMPFRRGEPQQVRAQSNLLYMLSFARQIPVLPRDLASLRLQKMWLLEALVMMFLERLLRELRRGLDHAYIRHEENSRILKGKILLSEHVRTNAAHRERFFVGYDEFVPDTWLNRVLKAACRRLLPMVQEARAQQRLREALLLLADVKDFQIEEHHFDHVHLNRNTERFAELFDFAKIVLRDVSPAPGRGQVRTFSLLFPMEQIFEEFVANFVREYSEDFGLRRHEIHAQAVHRRRWLLRQPDGSGKFRLRPDVVVDGAPKTTRLIVDTKWKRLVPDSENTTNDVRQSDLYQVYAYAHRYESSDNVLLYPMVPGASAKKYSLDGEATKCIRVEFLDLNRDFARDRQGLVADLRRVFAADSEPTPSMVTDRRGE